MNMQPQIDADFIALPIPIFFLLVTIGLVVYAVRKSSVGTWLPSLLAVIVLLIAGGVSGLYMTRMKVEREYAQEAKQQALEAELRAKEAHLRAEQALRGSLANAEDVNVVPVDIPGRDDEAAIPVESENKTKDSSSTNEANTKAADTGEDASASDSTETDDPAPNDDAKGTESADKTPVENVTSDTVSSPADATSEDDDKESGSDSSADPTDEPADDEESKEIALSPDAVSELPEWVINGVPIEEATDEDEYVIVSSRKHAFAEEARAEAISKTAAFTIRYLRMHHPELSGWRPSKQLIQQYAVFRQVHLEEAPKYGRLKLPRHRYYFQVRVWDGLADKMRPTWQAEVLNSRVAQLGLGFGFLTLIVGTVSTYLRMDSATDGNHRGKLKFAAAALVATATAAVSLIS